MKFSYVALGLTVLFVCSYLDTARGILLPVLSHSLAINYGATSWFLVAGYAASVLTTRALDRYGARLSTRALTTTILAAAVAATMFAILVDNYVTLVLLGGCVGACISGMGAVSNVLVIEGTDSSRRSRYLCALHMMYGLGSQVAPPIAALLLALGWGWKGVVIVGAPFFAAMALWAMRVLPKTDPVMTDRTAVVPFSTREARALAVMAIYGSGEVLLSTWMTTFLVEANGFSLARAAPYVSGFFVTMAATRALCFFRIRPETENRLLVVAPLLGIVFFLVGRAGFFWVLPLCGFLGPFYPLMISAISREFPTKVRSVNLRIVTCMQLALGTCHFTVGYWTDRWGIRTTYWLPAILLAIALILTLSRAKSQKV